MEGWLIALMVIMYLVCIGIVVITLYCTYKKKKRIKALKVWLKTH